MMRKVTHEIQVTGNDHFVITTCEDDATKDHLINYFKQRFPNATITVFTKIYITEKIEPKK